MKQQLIQYVELLFAGAEDCDDVKQEILQNTLDRYDDLVAEGKVPEAAYRLAIAGIGDINEILGASVPPLKSPVRSIAEETAGGDSEKKRLMRAVAVGLYIICILPLILLSEVEMEILGLCVTLLIVAAATVLMILAAKKDNDPDEEEQDSSDSPDRKLRDSVNSLIGYLGLAAYLIISFVTGAWYITWLMFPIIGAVEKLIDAIMDLKEAMRNEN